MLDILIHGLVSSAVLMLIAIGFSVTFGLSGVANFAHGGIYLLSGYLTWMLLNYLGLNYYLSIIITIIAMGVLGVLIYRFILMRVRGIELNEVVATLALGIGMLEFFRWAGFVTYEFNLQPLIRGSTSLLGVTVSNQRLLIIVTAFALSIFLHLYTRLTKSGLAISGMSQDEYTALSVGIDSDWSAMVSMALGCVFTAIAAIMVLPLGIISINIGYDVLLIALAVTVLGGVESTTGLVLASLILGYSQMITATYLASHYKEAVYLAAILIVLAIKPSGLIGKFKELEERV